MARRKQKKKLPYRDGPSQAMDDQSSNHGTVSEENLPYYIQYSPVLGRYLEAAKNLAAGDLIIKEKPLIVGPSQECSPLCLGCYTSLNFKESYRCNQCGFPLCSPRCTGKNITTGHSVTECSLLARTPVKTISLDVLQNSLDAITPLRCLALQASDPEAWKTVNKMEAHTEQRRRIPAIWNTNTKNVVNILRASWGLTEFEEETIHHVCGVLEVNAFEVGAGLQAIYPTAYLFAHRCVPNTKHSDDAQFNITFRTTTPVPKNSILFVTYTYILQGTLQRRKHLQETKFFECDCERCKDATECGTNISTLKCPRCPHGGVCSTQPLNKDAKWKCQSIQCPGYEIPASAVTSLTERIFHELDTIDGNDISGFEAFLAEHSKTLHEDHYLLLSAQHCLYQLYGKIEGYLINTLSDEQLERKVDICKNLLRAFNLLDPGLSKQRGLILYELHAPLMVLLQRSYHRKITNKAEIKIKLQEVMKCLKEAKKILEVEPIESQAGAMSCAAVEALANLTTWKYALNKT